MYTVEVRARVVLRDKDRFRKTSAQWVNGRVLFELARDVGGGQRSHEMKYRAKQQQVTELQHVGGEGPGWSVVRLHIADPSGRR